MGETAVPQRRSATRARRVRIAQLLPVPLEAAFAGCKLIAPPASDRRDPVIDPRSLRSASSESSGNPNRENASNRAQSNSRQFSDLHFSNSEPTKLPAGERAFLGCSPRITNHESRLTRHASGSATEKSLLTSHYLPLTNSVLLRDGACWRCYKDPKKILIATDAQSLQQTHQAIEEHRQAGGEAAGFLRYEAGYALEPHLRHLSRKAHAPLAWFGLYEGCEILPSLGASDETTAPLIRRSKLAITRAKYFSKLAAIRRYIEAGDVYQINFTTRVRFDSQFDAFDLFAALYHRHPAPYAAFVDTGDEQIVSLSPEMFFQIHDGHITVRPMKGTAPRGLLLEDDEAEAERLHASEKNRAENVMIVDLMRNDLGRICRPGSVKTISLFDVERYPSVWQMTSTVEGRLAGNCWAEAIVRALFPSGSVTGAPKIHAMEIIAKLETSTRGIYTGSIGYFGKDRAYFNVAIRTISLNGRKGTMGIGGGITHDSSAPEEWNECYWKAAFLLESEPQFKLIETFYWDGEYRLLHEHLARLRDSAKYWNFAYDDRQAISELQNASKAFPADPQRVRMLLSGDGKIEITHTNYASERFGRVAISTHAVSSRDRFLYHKTTNRALYERELAAARKRGLDDVVFFNERGELTEGTIHNVFVVKRGVWRTPPVACGLLPGIFRDHILKTHKNSREAILKLEDLDAADAIYLCNSVRGVFPVALERKGKRQPRNTASHQAIS